MALLTALSSVGRGIRQLWQISGFMEVRAIDFLKKPPPLKICTDIAAVKRILSSRTLQRGFSHLS